MSIDKVVASIEDNATELGSDDGTLYSGELAAPSESGDFVTTISAYDNAGNVSVATTNLVVDKFFWTEPKTDWNPTDRFNFVDYNRIKNNLCWLHEKAQELWKSFSIEDMGEDILSYESFWDVSTFNAFEKNLDTINKNIFTKDYGYTQTFFENAPFIQYDELNRIEAATLSMYEILKWQELNLRKLSFRLGTFKEVRI